MIDSKIFQKLTNHAKKSLEESKNIALYCKSKEIELKHLLWAIYLEKGSIGSNILKDIGISAESFDKFSPKKKDMLSQKAASKKSIELSKDAKKTIVKAYSMANGFGYPYVGTEHLVYAIIESSDEDIKEILSKSKPSKLTGKNAKLEDKSKNKIIANPNEQQFKASLNKDFLSSLSRAFNLPEMGFPFKGNSQQEAEASSLEYFCTNLNDEVKKNREIVIGREKEIDRAINTLGRKNKNNPLFIGEPGVGKTAIAAGLADKINRGDVPPNLLNKKILSLDIALVVAGTSFRGEFEQRLKDIIQEASEDKHIILFIDEIHSIVGAGNVNGGLDAANILKPSLSRGELQCIGATTLSEYKKYIEKDPALERRFQPIEVAEPSVSDAKKILFGVSKSYEKFHNITISKEALEKSVILSDRYIQDRFLPDKALDLLDETASRIRNKKQSKNIFKKIHSLELLLNEISKEKSKLINSEKYDEAIELRGKEEKTMLQIAKLKKEQRLLERKNPISIDHNDICETVSQITKIPLEKLLQKKADNLKKLPQKLSKKIIGQDKVIEELFNTLLRSQSGISSPHRPIGSFLFLGPTGVGKTFTAKILSEEFFQNKNSIIRIDMSEFMERHNVSQLIGAPAGYVGYGEGGRLTEKVRRNPYSIILFDEIEKAHVDVFNILLQILEEGTLTDSEGRNVNFKNTIIILTSNLGTSEFTQASQIGFEAKEKQCEIKKQFERIKEKTLSHLKKSIKPEILNRLDHIIVFDALGEQEIKSIIQLELSSLKKRLANQNVQLSFNSKAINFLTQKSLSLEQGARHIRKNIQNMIENKIAQLMLEHDSEESTLKISFDASKEEIIATVK
ncbi:MAG: ATP-dependent Clp protease ATP-binding subunit [Candidatus Moranbacteria bacterium]|nr:ATP-dependent Clp protease ATP-binding subunit [Candidatus Moranbacteria bacterium]